MTYAILAQACLICFQAPSGNADVAMDYISSSSSLGSSNSPGESEEARDLRLDLELEAGILAVLEKALAAEGHLSAETLVARVAQDLPRRQWRRALFGAPPPEGLDLRAFERPSRLGAIEVLRRSTLMLWKSGRRVLGVEEMSEIDVRNVTALCDSIPSLAAATVRLQAQERARRQAQERAWSQGRPVEQAQQRAWNL